MNKKNLTMIGVMLFFVLVSPAIAAAEADRDSLRLTVTVFNSLENFWSSTTGMRIPQMMLAVGGSLILFSTAFDVLWSRSRR